MRAVDIYDDMITARGWRLFLIAEKTGRPMTPEVRAAFAENYEDDMETVEVLRRVCRG